MKKPSNCPICRSNSLATFLRRKQVPVYQNLIMKDQRSALEIPRGDLSLAVCEDCGFVFNQDFEPSMMSYGEDYNNTQSCSSLFDDYLSNLARKLVVEKGVKNSRVVEVGCGKGQFLRKLIDMGGNIGYGFDPSYVGPDTDLEGRLRFKKCYYGKEWAYIPADVIVCRHVIEHLPDPLDLLYTIRRALLNSPRARVFFETPSVEWILRNQVIWDFFYEHCSYFTEASLTTAFEASGFCVESVQPVFGEQYLWLEARPLSQDKEPAVTKRPGSMPDLATEFAASESALKELWRVRVQKLAAKGKIAIWGGGAKGVTFANLIDPERRWIACAVDLNPHKQGGFLPGTGHPIIGYQELRPYNVWAAVLMNSNYRDENFALLRCADLKVELIDLMELRDEADN